MLVVLLLSSAVPLTCYALHYLDVDGGTVFVALVIYRAWRPKFRLYLYGPREDCWSKLVNIYLLSMIHSTIHPY
jgi:hypothetical protein